MKQIPTSGRATEVDAELPAAARALQTILEDLDDARTHRARLVNEGKRVASKDDIRSQVLEQAAKMSHGSSSGEVKPEWFEDIFEKELRKYHRLIDEMRAHCEQQERVLGTLEVGHFEVPWLRILILTGHTLVFLLQERNNQFLAQRQDDSRVKYREKRLQEMELAYWKWREIISNCEEGLNVSRFKRLEVIDASLITSRVCSTIRDWLRDWSSSKIACKTGSTQGGRLWSRSYEKVFSSYRLC
jgi:programmed cell death 6-interacting protein